MRRRLGEADPGAHRCRRWSSPGSAPVAMDGTSCHVDIGLRALLAAHLEPAHQLDRLVRSHLLGMQRDVEVAVTHGHRRAAESRRRVPGSPSTMSSASSPRSSSRCRSKGAGSSRQTTIAGWRPRNGRSAGIARRCSIVVMSLRIPETASNNPFRKGRRVAGRILQQGARPDRSRGAGTSGAAGILGFAKS